MAILKSIILLFLCILANYHDTKFYKMYLNMKSNPFYMNSIVIIQWHLLLMSYVKPLRHRFWKYDGFLWGKATDNIQKHLNREQVEISQWKIRRLDLKPEEQICWLKCQEPTQIHVFNESYRKPFRGVKTSFPPLGFKVKMAIKSMRKNEMPCKNAAGKDTFLTGITGVKLKYLWSSQTPFLESNTTAGFKRGQTSHSYIELLTLSFKRERKLLIHFLPTVTWWATIKVMQNKGLGTENGH